MMFSDQKMYTFLRGYATGAAMRETLSALTYARVMHTGQLRKSGEPYFTHPLVMACDALGLGIRDDDVIATILLHDVCEDCGVSVDELPVGDSVRHSVELVTFSILDGESKSAAQDRYFRMIIDDHSATITKLIDRCHNVSTMAGVFPKDKLTDYIEETRHYILPMFKAAKTCYPQDSDILFILKYHMSSVIDSIEATINSYAG